jgi:hypothetical protein
LLGGFDERFDVPGGGLLNLDTFRRAMELPSARRVVPLGEATFHQVHGGIATNAPLDGWSERLMRWCAQYVEIRGDEHRLPDQREPSIFIGTLSPHVLMRLVRTVVEPPGRRCVGPLGPSFDQSLWALAAPQLPADPVASRLVSLAQTEFREGRYEAVAAICRLTYARYPDEPEPQRLLSLVASYLPREGGLPPEHLRARHHLAIGRALALLGDTQQAMTELISAVEYDADLAEAHEAIARLSADARPDRPVERSR